MSVPSSYHQYIQDIHESFHDGNPISEEELMSIMEILCPSENTDIWKPYRTQCPLNGNTFLTLMYELHESTGIQYEDIVWKYIKGSLKKNLFNGKESTDIKSLRLTLDPLMQSVRHDVQNVYEEYASPDSDGKITIDHLCTVFKAMYPPDSTVYLEMYKWARAKKVERGPESLTEPPRVLGEPITAAPPPDSPPSHKSLPADDSAPVAAVAATAEAAAEPKPGATAAEPKPGATAESVEEPKPGATAAEPKAAERPRAAAGRGAAPSAPEDAPRGLGTAAGGPPPPSAALRFGPPLDFCPPHVRDLEPPTRTRTQGNSAQEHRARGNRAREDELLDAVLSLVSYGAPVDPQITAFLRELDHQERVLQDTLSEELERLTAAMTASRAVAQRIDAMRNARRAKCFDDLEKRRDELLKKMAAFAQSASPVVQQHTNTDVNTGKGAGTNERRCARAPQTAARPQSASREHKVDMARCAFTGLRSSQFPKSSPLPVVHGAATPEEHQEFFPGRFLDNSPPPRRPVRRAVTPLWGAATDHKALSSTQVERKIEERLLAYFAHARHSTNSN